MTGFEKRRRFVELRGRGMSYAKISEEIGVCKKTLIKWSKELSVEINNEQAMELERIQEEYLLGKEHRLKVAGTQLNQITNELLKRDLSKVSTYRLFDMQRKLIEETKEDCGRIVLTRERSGTVQESLDEIFHTQENWKG